MLLSDRVSRFVKTVREREEPIRGHSFPLWHVKTQRNVIISQEKMPPYCQQYGLVAFRTVRKYSLVY